MRSTVYLFKKKKSIKTLDLISTVYVKCWFTTSINHMGAAQLLLVSFALLFISLLAEKLKKYYLCSLQSWRYLKQNI